MSNTSEAAKEVATVIGLDGKLVEIIDKIQQGVVSHAPQAMELALNVVRVNAVSELLSALLVAVVAGCGVRSLWRIAVKMKGENDDGPWPLMYLASIIPLIALVQAAFTLLGAWNWVGVFYPELRLAKDVFDSVMR